jgi:tRNA pseudouridine55 synthase
MLCCIGRATKLAGFFLNGPKTYLATLRLGVETDTQDMTGRVMAVGETANLTATEVVRVMDGFRGEFLQTPPVFSALKHEGKPLYKLARSGKPVTKPPRAVHISALEIEQMALPVVVFQVTCSAGTYIRTLGADIGRALGCGGHIEALRRLSSCGFDISRALGLDMLADLAASGRIGEHLVSMAEALGSMPCHVADQRLAAHIAHGGTLTERDVPRPECGDAENYIKIVDTWNHLLAVLRAQDGAYQYCCVFPR